MPKRSLFWASAGVAAIALSYGAIVRTVHRKLLYMPRPYSFEYTQLRSALPLLREVNYQTSQGDQTSFFLPPLLPLTGVTPPRVWILFGGNAALALDWVPLVHAYRQQTSEPHGFLLIDSPGYGACAGTPSPPGMLETAHAAVEAVDKQTKLALGAAEAGAQQQPHYSVLAHSLGCAAAMQWVNEAKVPVDKVVLVSPFTSVADMARALLFPLPFLELLMDHNFDNKAQMKRRMQSLPSSTPSQTIIMHGARDEIVPVRMGKELAQLAKASASDAGAKTVMYHEFDVMHNDIFQNAKVRAVLFDELRHRL